ncbi:uncharacterized protein LOC106170085 [Lingula anatina]|uniref:Uncharacterized protein LOC106170085 n=1 Tax=Lingula anatina TaxID=7574 RepID=A0A1S3J4B2_LINAN|nr:uncharacterized protein LOC106170085 [Lingula anatina]|eukprot:XP_013405277.1 uncharacterized protein LOC106170085 [Lingula anatina]
MTQLGSMEYPALRGRTITALIVLIQIICLVKLAEGQNYSFCGTDNNYVNNVMDQTGYIISRRSGQIYYGNNIMCTWFLDAGAGNSLHFTIESSSLEPTSGVCDHHDYMVFYYGSTNSSRLRNVTWCGSDYPRTITTSGRYAYIRFKSNSADSRYSGIRLKYETFNNTFCPPGWATYNGSYCIQVKTHKEKWKDSHTHCTYDQANLVSISSRQEADFIAGMQNISSSYIWVGFEKYSSKNHDWKWIDPAEHYEPPGLFEAGESNTECAGFNPSSKSYVEMDCSAKNIFACKMIKGNNTVFPTPDRKEGEEIQWHWVGVGAGLFVVCFFTGTKMSKRKKNVTTLETTAHATSVQVNSTSSSPRMPHRKDTPAVTLELRSREEDLPTCKDNSDDRPILRRTYSDPNMRSGHLLSRDSRANSGQHVPDNVSHHSRENQQILRVDRLPDTGNTKARALPPINVAPTMPPVDSGTGSSWHYDYSTEPPIEDDSHVHLPPPPSYDEIMGVADHHH